MKPELLRVRCHPLAKIQKVIRLREGGFEVWFHAVPEKGRANKVLLSIISHELGVSPSELEIVRGWNSTTKLIRRL